ncbi:MAG: sugar phosphate isomerase/epimerase [Deltaproteobacteria bacterium]|nr:sugar phosphate isomerase/epimerase [Candidatus Anaeroferrophillacea bacterium]
MGRMFVHTPFARLETAIDLLAPLGVGPEIYPTAADLRAVDPVAAELLAERMRGLGMSCTMHAPFIDLSPGGFDPDIVAVTRARFHETFRLAEIFCPRTIVFHSGYDRWKYVHNLNLWLENSIRFWAPFLELAERADTYIAMENIFEYTPENIAALIAALNSPRFGTCFDIGHWRLFGTVDLGAWLAAVAPALHAVHLHDNHGEFDDHLVPGDGIIDYDEFNRRLAACGAAPRALTFEPHRQEDIARGVAWLKTHYGS